jgi:hypothetical protein
MNKDTIGIAHERFTTVVPIPAVLCALPYPAPHVCTDPVVEGLEDVQLTTESVNDVLDLLARTDISHIKVKNGCVLFTRSAR